MGYPSCWRKQTFSFFLLFSLWHVWPSTTAFTVEPPLKIYDPRSHCRSPARLPSSHVRLSSSSKWDNLVDDDDDDNYGPSVPPNMRYIGRNVGRQHQNFVAIREAGGVELTHDVYAREDKNEVFWYVGKVAHVSDVSLEHAVAKQWPIIEMHAAYLRPMELFPHRGRLELWTAPGDSELEVAYNRPTLVFQKMRKDVEGFEKTKVNTIGFQGEVYEAGFEGFRTWRTNDGRPARPELKPPESMKDGEEFRAPTGEELEEIQKKLEGKDINAIYEEQLRYEEQQSQEGKEP